MTAGPPPPPALAAAVRGGRWAEVRGVTAELPAPLDAPVALAAAMALRATGEPAKAREVARAALARAGELAAALRLEAGAASLALGEDPWPDLGPLFRRGAPAAPRRAAAALLADLAETAPLALVRAAARHPLPSGLKRELSASLAVRGSDTAAALRLVRSDPNGAETLRVARSLAGRDGLPAADRLAVARALLAGGWWREADAVLAALPADVAPALAFDLAFLRGRAAYRLERFDEAAGWFEQALTRAAGPEQRFEAAVQRARTAELGSDWPAALRMWSVARTAAPDEAEGWDGTTRALTALGRGDEAASVFLRAPPHVRAVCGPRLAAALLGRGARSPARRVLAALRRSSPEVRLLEVALAVADGRLDAAGRGAAALLADPRAGGWRELVLSLLPPAAAGAGPAPPARDPTALAALAVERGAGTARDALAAALSADPDWAGLLAATPPPTPPLDGTVAALGAVGLERVAAAMFAARFPSATPAELAWSARRLAAWGNRPAALTAGERLWRALGGVPAGLVPDRLLAAILPEELVGACAGAARAHGVSAALMVGIVREESRFAGDARSAAGALGLAQLVPETARRLGADPEQALHEDRALGLAASVLAGLDARFAHRLVPVAAAYNAGPAIVTAWLGAVGPDAAEPLVAAAIPYSETSGYVLGVAEGVALGRALDGPPEPASR